MNDLKKQLYLQNYKIVLFNYSDSKITYAVLERGLNNRYKYLHSGISDGYTYAFQQSIGKHTYFICLGYNKSNNAHLQISPSLYFKNDISNYIIRDYDYSIVYKITNPNKCYYFKLYWL